MFALSAKRLFYACDNFLIRSFITGTKLEYPRGNPGIENRLKAFRQDGIKIREDNVEEYIEESESSFYNVDDIYDQHLNETLMGKHELRGHIVKEKYFKENMPNLLTWSEKEQIRHLASTQPQEWTPQKLAESFPVTENVVKKLLKYPWKPATEQRIARHDASAMRNWRELKEGTLDIPESLRQHFLKFSERTIPPLNRKSIKIDISQETMGEFEEIVKRENNNEKAASSTNINDDSDESNTTKNEKPNIKSDFRRVTLDELANKIKSRLDHGLNVDVPDRIIADSLTTYEKSENTQDNSKEIELVQTTSKEGQLTQFKENDKDVIGVNYPERIRIPKKAFKKGATYKMNDCFYDDDGRFLYRVIGMSDNKN